MIKEGTNRLAPLVCSSSHRSSNIFMGLCTNAPVKFTHRCVLILLYDNIPRTKYPVTEEAFESPLKIILI
jgi:hypothetical protein